MGQTRPATVAGSFYPAEPAHLAATVDSLLGAVRRADHPGAVVALVVPHAGYAYSAPVAASAGISAQPVRGKGAIWAVVEAVVDVVDA